ncbi:MAG: PASTA domain-containing protein [Bacteroidales bacterium]|nr:PASTA domain-containing protein [Bacteroidales bacterium]
MFFKQLALSAGMFLGLVVILLIVVRFYTDHGKGYVIPDLKHMPINQVDSVLTKLGMRYQINDSVFVPNFEAGTVVDHHPPGGSKVKTNRKVFIVINANSPELIVLPTVTGVSFRQAKAILESHGLVLGKIHYKPDIAQNYVLEQLYKGHAVATGDSVLRGSKIDLVLGNGLSDISTPVPDFIGKKPEDVKAIISNYYLNLGAVVYDNTILNADDSANAFIFKQKPEAHGNRIPQGSFIDVWLTVDSTKTYPEIEAEN